MFWQQEITFQSYLIFDYEAGTRATATKQEPLKKWTEHSQELHLLKIHSSGASITPRGWMGVDYLDHELL